MYACMYVCVCWGGRWCRAVGQWVVYRSINVCLWGHGCDLVEAISCPFRAVGCQHDKVYRNNDVCVWGWEGRGCGAVEATCPFRAVGCQHDKVYVFLSFV